MTRTIIATERAPQPFGHYSQAILAGGLVFVAGQLGVDPVSRTVVEGGVGAQTERALRNIVAVLETAGSGLDKIVRCGVFLKDMADSTVMNETYARFFPSESPARTTVGVARLPQDVLVEIDAIALAPSADETRERTSR